MHFYPLISPCYLPTILCYLIPNFYFLFLFFQFTKLLSLNKLAFIRQEQLHMQQQQFLLILTILILPLFIFKSTLLHWEYNFYNLIFFKLPLPLQFHIATLGAKTFYNFYFQNQLPLLLQINFTTLGATQFIFNNFYIFCKE